VDRVDDLERFCLELEPSEIFRPNRLWQLPLTGLHDYTLPETIRARLGGPEELAEALRDSPVELVVCVTDVGDTEGAGGDHAFERTYSSRRTPPELLFPAVLASAAISALVLPVRIGETIGTDGGWVRNFPLAHAYDNEAVESIVGFRYVARYPLPSSDGLTRLRRRLDPFRAVPPVRALIGELDEAAARVERGEPAHLPEMIVRLMRVTIARNTALEERLAGERDASVAELESLRRDAVELAARHASPWRRGRARRAVEARFAAARFPFRRDRRLPRVIVHGDAGEHALEPSFRAGLAWPLASKLALIERGYELADEALGQASGLTPGRTGLGVRPEA
jgi:predicted acylesterase/phospholipase RssA